MSCLRQSWIRHLGNLMKCPSDVQHRQRTGTSGFAPKLVTFSDWEKPKINPAPCTFSNLNDSVHHGDFRKMNNAS
ncbi:uncharacterized [Tachysurus ichikawai]